MPLIAVTRLRVRSWLYFPAFILNSDRSAKQAAAAHGNLSVRLLRDRDKAFWTMSAWAGESEMKAFMTAGAHGAVMRKLLDWCDEAALAHWTQDSAELPTWDEAHRRLLQSGRLSKVHNPSANHLAFAIAPPLAGPTRERRLKS